MHLGSLKAILSIQRKSTLKRMSRLGVVVQVCKTGRISSSRLAQATSEDPTSKKCGSFNSVVECHCVQGPTGFHSSTVGKYKLRGNLSVSANDIWND